mgnify:CR=1 FL=1
MNYSFIKQRIAACGLHCGKCFAFTDGKIGNTARELKALLGNFDRYAERFVDLLDETVFENYPVFNDMLSYFSNPQCRGCREESCKLFEDCNVRKCSEEKNVDFCFECDEFPCNNTGFDKHLYERFVKINLRIKKIGAEKYYDEIKNLPRY